MCEQVNECVCMIERYRERANDYKRKHSREGVFEMVHSKKVGTMSLFEKSLQHKKYLSGRFEK